MEKRILIARVRQLQALDKNAFDIYTDLSESVKDEAQRKVFFRIANDERRHVSLAMEMLSLLEK